MYFSFNTTILPHISFMNRCSTPEHWKHPRRTTNEYILFIILSGEMYLQEDEKRYVLRRGDYIFLHPMHTHLGYKYSQCEYCYIHFPSDCLSGWDCAEIPQIMQIILDNKKLVYQCDPFGDELYTKYKLFVPKDRHIYFHSTLQQITACIDEALLSEKRQMSHYKLICSSLFIQIMILLSRDFVANLFPEYPQGGSSENSDKVYSLIHYLHNHYAEPISGDWLSEYFDINFDSLNRLFKQETGVPIFHYLKQVRLNHARELLTTTQLKMSEISEQTGFCDQYYFSRVFKQEFGISPKKYSISGTLDSK